MKYHLIFLVSYLILNTMNLTAETAYQHFNTDELMLANILIKAYKAGDESSYYSYVESKRTLRRALDICKNGLAYRLLWDDKNQRFFLGENTKKNEYGIGKMVYDFLVRTKTIVMFTKGFGSNSTTGGKLINGHWQLGEMKTIGKDGEYLDKDGNIKKYENYKIREYNVLWLSADLEKSPVAIALLLAHEVGHGLAEEYRANYPLPYEDSSNSVLNKPPYTFFPNDQKYDDEMWCYPFEGMMAEELGLTTYKELHMNTAAGRKISINDYSWYEENIGQNVRFPQFYEKLRIKYCLECKLSYLSRPKKQRCGMRCKFFNQYQYCDNVVKSPPCHLWKKHLESWTSAE